MESRGLDLQKGMGSFALSFGLDLALWFEWFSFVVRVGAAAGAGLPVESRSRLAYTSG